MKTDKNLDTNVYIIGWACILTGLIYFAIRIFLHVDLLDYAGPCVLYSTTGFYCFGCGGTRAVFAFLRGDILASLYYHPLVPYAMILGGCFMVSQTVERCSRGRIAIGMHFRMLYLWIALGLMVVQFVWKNGMILLEHIPE